MTAELITPRVSLGAKADGRFVEVTVGNRSFTLDYDSAFRFAVLIYGNAKIAKRNVGDSSRLVYGFANLTDASMDELKAQRSRDNTAMFVKAG